MAKHVLARRAPPGLRAQATIAVAFGCPFEGEVPVRRVLDIAAALAEEAPVEIALADTVGVGVPGQVLELYAASCARSWDRFRCARTSTTRATPASRTHSPRCRRVSRRSMRASAASAVVRSRRKRPATSPTEDLIYMLDRMRIGDGRRTRCGDRDVALARHRARQRTPRDGESRRRLSARSEQLTVGGARRDGQ